MRRNSKQLRFLCGAALLCAIGALGYREVSQSVSTLSKPSAAIQLFQASIPQGLALTTAVEASSAPQQAAQKLEGFSSDSRHFIYLESWRDTGAGIPQAALHLVNLSTNTCVEKGCLQTSYSESDAGLSIEAAEERLLQQTQTLRQTLNLTQPIAGSRLPIVSKSRTADGTEVVTVRLHNGQPLQLRLQQTNVVSALAGGTAEKDRTAIALTAAYQGKEQLISHPNQWHDWVLDFSIREVRQSPDGKRVVVLLTAAKRAFEGTLDRTFIQSLALHTE